MRTHYTVQYSPPGWLVFDPEGKAFPAMRIGMTDCLAIATLCGLWTKFRGKKLPDVAKVKGLLLSKDPLVQEAKRFYPRDNRGDVRFVTLREIANYPCPRCPNCRARLNLVPCVKCTLDGHFIEFAPTAEQIAACQSGSTNVCHFPRKSHASDKAKHLSRA